MDPLVYAFWTAKLGNNIEEYEDAFAFSTTNRHFAIADGATESSFADRWAQSLVHKYSQDPPGVTVGRTPFPEWMAPLQKEWHKGIDWSSLPWFAEEKARAGAFAAFLGLSFTTPHARKAPVSLTRFQKKSDLDKLTWHACAVGDSCLFQVRGDSLLKSFPYTRADQFNSTPFLLCSNPRSNARLGTALQIAEGDCRPDDTFFLLTDALAKWFLVEKEAGKKPWIHLGRIHGHPQFNEFVQSLRAAKSIRNDDTTMLSFQWVKESSKSSKTILFKKSEIKG